MSKIQITMTEQSAEWLLTHLRKYEIPENIFYQDLLGCLSSIVGAPDRIRAVAIPFDNHGGIKIERLPDETRL